METEAYLQAIKAFEQDQGSKGDAGCYAELYPVLRSAASRLNILKGFLAEGEYERRMAGLVTISQQLPDLHDEAVLEEALKKIQALTRF